MPFHMHFSAEDLLRCRFAISPLWETREAVRTLFLPDRHGHHLPWLRRMRHGAAGLDLAPLRLLMPHRGRGPDFLSPPPDGLFVTIEDELARVRATDPDVAHADLTRALAETPGAALTPAGRTMLAEPARAVRDLADLLARTWDTLIAPYWPRMNALLEADVAFHSRRLAAGGLEQLFADLHPRLTWSDGTLSIGRSLEHVRFPGGEGLLLVPSVFVWPDVVGGFAPPWQTTVIYPARGAAGLGREPGAHATTALVRLLGANRAAILTTLDAPATTTNVAHRHSLALSSVSAHLTVLREAGLLTSRRLGHRVLYERTPLGIALANGDG